MKVAGFVRFAVDISGENTWLIDYTANDLVVQEYLGEFVEEVGDLIDMNQVLQLKPDIVNSLLLVTFSHEFTSSFNGESTDYDSESNVIDVLVLNDSYKEQWRINLTTEHKFSTLEELNTTDDETGIEEWEEFYDEDFEFFKPKTFDLGSFKLQTTI